jgi:hypothetical protein
VRSSYCQSTISCGKFGVGFSYTCVFLFHFFFFNREPRPTTRTPQVPAHSLSPGVGTQSREARAPPKSAADPDAGRHPRARERQPPGFRPRLRAPTPAAETRSKERSPRPRLRPALPGTREVAPTGPEELISSQEDRLSAMVSF